MSRNQDTKRITVLHYVILGLEESSKGYYIYCILLFFSSFFAAKKDMYATYQLVS